MSVMVQPTDEDIQEVAGWITEHVRLWTSQFFEQADAAGERLYAACPLIAQGYDVLMVGNTIETIDRRQKELPDDPRVILVMSPGAWSLDPTSYPKDHDVEAGLAALKHEIFAMLDGGASEAEHDGEMSRFYDRWLAALGDALVAADIRSMFAGTAIEDPLLTPVSFEGDFPQLTNWQMQMSERLNTPRWHAQYVQYHAHLYQGQEAPTPFI